MCDGRKDCKYGRDEYACEFIVIEKSQYRKAEVPKNPFDDGPLNVTVSFDVQDIVQIHEPKVRSISRDLLVKVKVFSIILQ